MNEQDGAVRGIVPLPVHPLTAILAIIAGGSATADPCWSTTETQLPGPGTAAEFLTTIDEAPARTSRGHRRPRRALARLGSGDGTGAGRRDRPVR
jgi:hypothetical protein